MKKDIGKYIKEKDLIVGHIYKCCLMNWEILYLGQHDTYFYESMCYDKETDRPLFSNCAGGFRLEDVSKDYELNEFFPVHSDRSPKYQDEHGYFFPIGKDEFQCSWTKYDGVQPMFAVKVPDGHYGDEIERWSVPCIESSGETGEVTGIFGCINLDLVIEEDLGPASSETVKALLDGLSRCGVTVPFDFKGYKLKDYDFDEFKKGVERKIEESKDIKDLGKKKWVFKYGVTGDTLDNLKTLYMTFLSRKPKDKDLVVCTTDPNIADRLYKGNKPEQGCIMTIKEIYDTYKPRYVCGTLKNGKEYYGRDYVYPEVDWH